MYEYMVLGADQPANAEQLNNYSKDGWNLVSVCPLHPRHPRQDGMLYVLYLRRLIPIDANKVQEPQ